MLPDIVRFWTILVVLVPSLICCFFAIYHLLLDRASRRALHNDVIIVLLAICLLYETTDYSWMLYYYFNRGSWRRSYTFCLFTGFLDWSLYIAHTLIFAWAMIERHILIFHDQWVSTRKRRLFVHYLPLAFLLLYWFTFYFVIYFFPPCDNRLRPTYFVCIYPCLYDNYILSMWDYLVHQILPIGIIATFSVGLVVRVICQKHRMRRAIHWKKHRKMTVQALSISFLHLIFLFPYTIVYIIRNIYLMSSPLITEFNTYTVFLSYFIVPFSPIVYIISSTELKAKIGDLLRLNWRTTRVTPVTNSFRRIRHNRCPNP